MADWLSGLTSLGAHVLHQLKKMSAFCSQNAAWKVVAGLAIWIFSPCSLAFTRNPNSTKQECEVNLELQIRERMVVCHHVALRWIGDLFLPSSMTARRVSFSPTSRTSGRSRCWKLMNEMLRHKILQSEQLTDSVAAPSSQSKKVVGTIPMFFSLYLCGYCLGSPATFQSPKTCMSGNWLFAFLCGPTMKWPLIQPFTSS